MKLHSLHALVLAGSVTAHLSAASSTRPNILFVLADDQGYGDVGVLFQNSRATNNDRAEPWHFTPQLDKLAAEGIQLRHHYCPASVCAPSRASLLLGVHQGHANVRDNQFDKDLSIDTNTLVVFTSDNGPSIESYLPQNIAANFFNSFGPFDGIKRDLWEGGLRVPALARWPGHIPPGTVSRQPSQSHDWLPTFAELAGLPVPARSDGVSLVPTLLGTTGQRPSTIYSEYYYNGAGTPNYAEFVASHRNRTRNQMRMIRLGDLVGVRYNISSHAGLGFFGLLNAASALPALRSGRPRTAWPGEVQRFHVLHWIQEGLGLLCYTGSPVNSRRATLESPDSTACRFG